jgi:transcriptional regulator with XRE-family HTH domain
MSRIKEEKHEALGTLLKNKRQEKGFSTTEMARRCEVNTRKTVENWEKNDTIMNINKFILFMEACDIKPKDAMEEYYRAVLQDRGD